MPLRSESVGYAIALWILAVIATLFFLRAASTLLIPIVIGILISYALEPVVAWMERRHVPRMAGASLVMLVLLGACGWGLYSLRDDIGQALETLPEAARRARDLFADGSGSGPIASIKEAAQELSGTETAPDGGAGAAATGANATGAGDNAAAGGQAASAGAPAAGMFSMVQQGVMSVLTLAGNIVVVIFLVFFLLLSGNDLGRRMVEIAGRKRDDEGRRTAVEILQDINEQIQRFLLVRLFTAIVVGLATWGVLAWMGVQNAAVWGALAGLFNSIPYFGPVIVSGGLLVVGLVQAGGLTQALQMSGAALVITSLEGWLLTPPLLGKAERMSIMTVFLGLLLWTWIWGAWGMLLAVPMLVVIKAVADHVDSLNPVARLMAP